MTLRGTLTYTVREPVHENRAGALYIFASDDQKGELLTQPHEGDLLWHQISELPALEDLATYQNFYLHRILTDDSYFYSGIAAYNGMELVHHVDSASYFAERFG